MDIHRITHPKQTLIAASNKKNKSTDFREVFDQKLSADTVPELLNHGDRILDLLDVYRSDLANPEKTLKEIGPLVESIEREVEVIQAKAAMGGQKDRELTELVTNLSVTANVAMFKFHRGDYT